MVTLFNPSAAPAVFTLSDPTYTHIDQYLLTVPAGGQSTHVYDVASSFHWYDVVLTGAGQSWRAKGRLENGQITRSDPAMSRGA